MGHISALRVSIIVYLSTARSSLLTLLKMKDNAEVYESGNVTSSMIFSPTASPLHGLSEQ